MPNSAKTFLLNVEHEADPNVKFENYFAQAIQRYDYVIYLYGTSEYTDYIGRVEANKFTPLTSAKLINGSLSDSSNSTALVVIVAVTSLSSILGLLIIKKTKAIH